MYKKLFLTLIVSICFGFGSKAQIIHEQTYLNSWEGTTPIFQIVNLGNNNYKYVHYDRINFQIILYNLNHTIYKTISVPIGGTNFVYGYVSSNLFDCDTSNIEFMVTSTSGSATTRVYDELGNLIFNEFGTSASKCESYCPSLPYEFKDIIFNTPEGTKMILYYTGDSTRVYGLCGTYSPVSIKELNENQLFLNAYPNPSINQTKIKYELPKGVQKGQLLIFNSVGELVKTYNVGKEFNYITVPTSEYSQGTYIYSLKTSQGLSDGKRLVIVK